MAKLSTEINNFFIREYVIQTFVPIESFRIEYPSLIFEMISSNIIYVQIPEGAESEFTRLYNAGYFISIPTLYGLYAKEALAGSNISMFHDYPFGGLRGNNVIIGFVDTGIDYTNPLFQNADGTTRIIRLWDQTIQGNTPQAYNYGSEYTQEIINEALASPNPYDIVPSRDEIGHGTFLAGVAAGDEKNTLEGYRGGAPDAVIAMVKLRPARTYLKEYYLVKEDTIAYQDNDIIAGLSYLLQISRMFQMPLVICIGIGNIQGAHDGTTMLELYLSGLTIFRNLIIVVAAGNEANSGHHFEGRILQDERQDIEINVINEQDSGFIAYLWARLPDKLAVSIRSPIGQVVQRVPIISHKTTTYRFELERTLISITYNYPNTGNGQENVIIRFQNPTQGIWMISVYGELIIDGEYNMWLQRDHFISEETRFLRAQTSSTIAIPSTSQYVLTAGAYDHVEQSIYVGSGRGPTTDSVIKPVIIAPGVNIPGPDLSGGYTTYTGTSIAAAIVSSAAALLMQWAVINGNLQDMNTRIAIGVFIRGASRRIGIEYPNNIEGYGRLDLRNSINSIW